MVSAKRYIKVEKKAFVARRRNGMKQNTHNKISVKSFVIIFDVLESIRSEIDMDKGVWAESSKIKAPRLSEIYRLLNAYKEGVFNTTKIGRALTSTKLTALIEGMMKHTNSKRLIKKLLEQLNMSDDLDVQLQIAYTICNLRNKEKLLKHLKNFLDMTSEEPYNTE